MQICYDSLPVGTEEGLVFCLAACGQALHDECHRQVRCFPVPILPLVAESCDAVGEHLSLERGDSPMRLLPHAVAGRQRREGGRQRRGICRWWCDRQPGRFLEPRRRRRHSTDQGTS